MPRLRSQSRSRSPHRRRRDDRSRSRSPSQRHRHHRDKDHGRDQERDRERSRSRSPIRLPAGAEPISESDYFKKLDEFKIWLKDEKDRVSKNILLSRRVWTCGLGFWLGACLGVRSRCTVNLQGFKIGYMRITCLGFVVRPLMPLL